MTVRLIVHCLPVVLLLAGSVSPVGAQNANDGPTGKIRELNETPVAEASKHIGDLVMMKGSTSRYKPDPTNASVYDLKDQYGDTLSVRGSNRQMALDQIYVVVGTLAKRSDGKPELIEIKRLAPKPTKDSPSQPSYGIRKQTSRWKRRALTRTRRRLMTPKTATIARTCCFTASALGFC